MILGYLLIGSIAGFVLGVLVWAFGFGLGMALLAYVGGGAAIAAGLAATQLISRPAEGGADSKIEIKQRP